MTKPSPAKRPRSSYRRFEAMKPNGIWQLDGHETTLQDGSKVVLLRYQDDYSRAVMATRAAVSENGADAWECLVSAMNRWGKPALILCDNSGAFTSRFVRGVSGFAELETRLRLIGVSMINSSPRHPQTCGKKEREWQTLEQWLAARKPSKDLPQLQLLVDAYDHLFNTRRPHQGIDGVTPEVRYHATAKAEPDPDRVLDRSSIHTVHASTDGCIELPRLKAHLGRAWAGATIDYLVDHDHAILFTGTNLIAHIDLNRDDYIGKPRGKRGYRHIDTTHFNCQ